MIRIETFKPQPHYQPHSRMDQALPPLAPQDREALLDLMQCWLHQELWRPGRGCELSRIREYAERHNLGGIMGAVALANHGERREDGSSVNDPTINRYFSNILHHARALACLKRFSAIAGYLDVPYFVVKGPALVRQAYGDGGLRGYSDIDLYVPSRTHALRIFNDAGTVSITDSDRGGFVERHRDPGRVVVMLDGWTLEIRYPLPGFHEPMFELLSPRYEDRIEFHTDYQASTRPDPSWHFLYLLQHMLVHHFFSRLIWFLDLAVLVREQKTNLDFDWIDREAAHLKLKQALSLASRFCRRHIDPNFPDMGIRSRAWNTGFQEELIRPEHIIAERFSQKHPRALYRYSNLFLHAICFYLLTDPPIGRNPFNKDGGDWIAARVFRGLRLRNPAARSIVKRLVKTLGYSLARLACLLFERREGR